MWNELLTTALVGTKRRPFKLENLPDGKLGELLAQFAQHEPEHALLGAAAAYTLYRRTGQVLPLNDSPLPEPCDLDDLTPCSPRAALQLGQMVAHSIYTPLLQEWFGAAAQVGKRIADEHLPVILNYYQTRRNSLPPAFFEVLGKRGRWLAQQNPAWAYAVLPADESEWRIADRSAQVSYLQKLRQHDPGQARMLIESVWASENAETRSKFIRTLDINLSLDDEPFLETALDDRGAGASLWARLALSNLPGSALSRRMIARAEPLIKIRRAKKKLVIDLKLPEAIDESMIRDGIPADSPDTSSLGTRANWLFSIVGMLPASYWFGGDWTPAELVRAANENVDWKKQLLYALNIVAEGEHHHELAEALLLHGESEEVAGTSTLIAATPGAREAYVLRALKQHKGTLDSDHPAIEILRRLEITDHLWSAELTHAFIERAAKTLQEEKSTALVSISPFIANYALKMSPAYADAFKELVNQKNPALAQWNTAVRSCATLLDFRQMMHKELSR